MKYAKGWGLLLLSASLLVSTACRAEEEAAAGVSAMTQNGIRYVSGGVGMTQQEALKAMRKDYNLLLTFAVKKSGAYLADVQVRIQDA